MQGMFAAPPRVGWGTKGRGSQRCAIRSARHALPVPPRSAAPLPTTSLHRRTSWSRLPPRSPAAARARPSAPLPATPAPPPRRPPPSPCTKFKCPAPFRRQLAGSCWACECCCPRTEVTPSPRPPNHPVRTRLLGFTALHSVSTACDQRHTYTFCTTPLPSNACSAACARLAFCGAAPQFQATALKASPSVRLQFVYLSGSPGQAHCRCIDCMLL